MNSLSSMKFDEDYFERGLETGKSCYSNYRWIPDLTIPMAHHIVSQLEISHVDEVLDYGCAKGYLVHALRLLGIKAHGVDISSYAVGCAPREVANYIICGGVSELPHALDGDLWEWIIAKDVLEHECVDNIDSTLQVLRVSCRNMFVVVPLGDGAGKYVAPSQELDPTHEIRDTLDQWSDRFMKAGFSIVKASYSMYGIKGNYTIWDKGNGFFTLRSS